MTQTPESRSDAGPAPRPGPPDLSTAQRAALARRDPRALEEFFEAYFTPLYQYLWRMLGNVHQAEDLTQETFMQIHRNLERYDPARPLRPWVFTIATNLVRDLWRSAPHRAARSAEELEDAVGRERFEEERPGPAAVAEGREVGDQVAQAVADLPEALRTTFVLRFYQGLSFEEIAQAVERTEVAVRKRFSRALEQLRQDLAHLDPGGQGFLRGGKVH